MTSLVDQHEKTRLPLILSAWDFAKHPVHWWGEDFEDADKPTFTGQRSDPALYLVWRLFEDSAGYLSAREDQVFLSAELGILVEPIVDDRRARVAADAILGYYAATTQPGFVFRVPERRFQQFGDDEGWNRWDLTIPIWHFPPQSGSPSSPGALNGQEYSQAGHGFAKGDWVGLVSGTWQKVSTADDPTVIAVVTNVVSSSVFRAVAGDLALYDHGFSTGDRLWLSSTAGVATSTDPDPGPGPPAPGTVVHRIGVVTSSGGLLVQQFPRVVA